MGDCEVIPKLEHNNTVNTEYRAAASEDLEKNTIVWTLLGSPVLPVCATRVTSVLGQSN